MYIPVQSVDLEPHHTVFCNPQTYQCFHLLWILVVVGLFRQSGLLRTSNPVIVYPYFFCLLLLLELLLLLGLPLELQKYAVV
jgi:hypothetical protein